MAVCFQAQHTAPSKPRGTILLCHLPTGTALCCLKLRVRIMAERWGCQAGIAQHELGLSSLEKRREPEDT